MDDDQLQELLYQALETELGGVQIYESALRCVKDEELRTEWERYLAQTTHHVELVEQLIRDFDLDSATETRGRTEVRYIGNSLVNAMEASLEEGLGEATELLAAECVTLAETKDHLNWELLGEASRAMSGLRGKALKAVVQEVEQEEDEHLYHSARWTRELWLDALGIRAVLPPPEERKNVRTAIGPARAKQSRSSMK